MQGLRFLGLNGSGLLWFRVYGVKALRVLAFSEGFFSGLVWGDGLKVPGVPCGGLELP